MGDQLQLVTAANAFPVLAQQIHGQPLAYLDNAATTQVPLTVLAAMRRFEDHDRANIHRGVHTLSQRATDAFEASRDTLKRFIGADASQELVFTSGTSTRHRRCRARSTAARDGAAASGRAVGNAQEAGSRRN